jgi:hypothetical protein
MQSLRVSQQEVLAIRFSEFITRSQAEQISAGGEYRLHESIVNAMRRACGAPRWRGHKTVVHLSLPHALQRRYPLVLQFTLLKSDSLTMIFSSIVARISSPAFSNGRGCLIRAQLNQDEEFILVSKFRRTPPSLLCGGARARALLQDPCESP